MLLLVALMVIAACSPSVAAGKMGGHLLAREGPAPGVLVAAAPPAVPSPVPVTALPTPLVVAYRIEVRSPDPSLGDVESFISQVLEDPRGWQQAGIDFQQHPDGEYLVVVAEGAEVQELCRPYDIGGQFSCQNGPVVALNAIRWREGVAHWPADLDAYRTMLVNHEVGHLIGMHHIRCAEDGAQSSRPVAAPVMEQQSATLRGCEANPWPTAIEVRLAATHQFGIAPSPLDVAFPQ